MAGVGGLRCVKTEAGTSVYRQTHTHTHWPRTQPAASHGVKLVRSEGPRAEFNFVGFNGELRDHLRLLDATLLDVRDKAAAATAEQVSSSAAELSVVHLRRKANASFVKQMDFLTRSWVEFEKIRREEERTAAGRARPEPAAYAHH